MPEGRGGGRRELHVRVDRKRARRSIVRARAQYGTSACREVRADGSVLPLLEVGRNRLSLQAWLQIGCVTDQRTLCCHLGLVHRLLLDGQWAPESANELEKLVRSVHQARNRKDAEQGRKDKNDNLYGGLPGRDLLSARKI